MVCDECGKNEATVHLTKINNGQKMEIKLCENCAKKRKEIDMESPFSIHQFLTGLLDNVHEEPMPLEFAKGVKCEQCGLTYGQFKETGQFGCSGCYDSFRSRLIPLFRRLHGHEEHTGKVPKIAGGRIRVKQEIKELKKKLNQVVSKEEFEKAAELRDQIKALQRQLEQD